MSFFQFASVEVVITSIEDQFGIKLMKVLKRREFLVLIVCVVSYFLGFPTITNVRSLFVHGMSQYCPDSQLYWSISYLTMIL